jgi:hypothetical protein
LSGCSLRSFIAISTACGNATGVAEPTAFGVIAVHSMGKDWPCDITIV